MGNVKDSYVVSDAHMLQKRALIPKGHLEPCIFAEATVLFMENE